MSTVTSTVVNLQCNYLSQTKTCGQKWQEMSIGGNSAQEMGNLDGQSIPFYPAGAKWNENLFHFAPAGYPSMLHRSIIEVKQPSIRRWNFGIHEKLKVPQIQLKEYQWLQNWLRIGAR